MKNKVTISVIDIADVVLRDEVEQEYIEPALNEEERKRLLSESAKLRARARRQYLTYCREETCGKEIVGLTRRKFCGQNCQRRHWRRRLAAMNPGDALPKVE